MKQTQEKIFRIFAVVLLLAVAAAPQSTLLRPANAQDRTINVNEALDLNDLRIKNEVQQINSLLDAQGKFFKRAFALRSKGTLSLDEKTQLQTEAVQSKTDLAALQRQFESLINKLKQGNHWNDGFDAQFLASLKNPSDRSLLTQAGGARKLLEAGAKEFTGLRDDIDQEVQQSTGRHYDRFRSRRDRVFAAHARPPVGKFGCAALLASYILATASGSENSISCALALVYNRRGCTPGIVSGADCH